MRSIRVTLSAIVPSPDGQLTKLRDINGNFPPEVQRSIEELALEIDEVGSRREPVVSRSNDGHFLLLSGEGRYYAHCLLGVSEMVVTLDEEPLCPIAA